MGWLCVLPSQDAADRVGVKLDFKDPAAVLPALKSVGSRWTDKMADLLWLNADILPGPCTVPRALAPPRLRGAAVGAGAKSRRGVPRARAPVPLLRARA